MEYLFILNDSPSANERCFNGLRLAKALSKRGSNFKITVFLMGDAVRAASDTSHHPISSTTEEPLQHTDVQPLIGAVLEAGGEVKLCGTCIDSRGLTMDEMIDGTTRGNMEELARLTIEAKQVVSF